MHRNSAVVESFIAKLQQRSNGQIQVINYPSGQLFGIKDITSGIASGAVQLGGVVSDYSFSSIDSNYLAASIPFSFKNYDEARNFIRNTPTDKSVWQKILDKHGLVLIADIPTGPLVTFSTDIPLDNLDNFQNLKIRAVALTDRSLMESLGAKWLTLPTSEVFMALQSGMLNSITTPVTAVEAYNWGAYLKHALLPPYSYSDGHIFANKQWFESLPIELQKTLLEVGNEISIESTSQVMADVDASLARYEAAGMTLHRLTDNEVDELRRITKEKVIPRLQGHVTAEIIQTLELYMQKKATNNTQVKVNP